MILVTGATGRVGRHLVTGLLADGEPVRALTRDPAAADLPADAEVAPFDPGRPETIEAAAAGTDAVFVNATAVGAVIDELVNAVRRAGVRRVVVLSSLTVRDDGDQPYALGVQHKMLEDAVAAAAAEWSVLRCGLFAANSLAWWAPTIRAEGVVRAPYLEAAVAPIAERDIASAAVRVLRDDGHSGATYVLTGPRSTTQAGQVRAIGAAIGRDISVEELTPEDYRRAMAAHLPAAVADDLLRYLGAFVGRTAEISPDLGRLTGQPGTTFSELAAENADGFR